MTYIRHGDVNLLALPDALEFLNKVQAVDGLTLAYGEVTGHSHRFPAGSQVQMYELPVAELEPARKELLSTFPGMASLFRTLETITVIQVVEPAPLVHEEHAALMVPAGTYIQYPQREYQPQAPRWVID